MSAGVNHSPELRASITATGNEMNISSATVLVAYRLLGKALPCSMPGSCLIQKLECCRSSSA